MEWLCSGFERNKESKVIIYWECSKCGHEEAGNGLDSPRCNCPKCGAKVRE